jgi:membrane protein implicated in regulation of membrane protease activity
MWILFGFLLLVCELLTPGVFFLVFFGLGAITVGLLVMGNLLEPAWVQWSAFSAISLLSVLLFRKPLIRRVRTVRGADDLDSPAGETAVALDEILPGSVGRAELRGTIWQVKNVGDAPLGARQRARVERVEGLVLWVRSQ